MLYRHSILWLIVNLMLSQSNAKEAQVLGALKNSLLEFVSDPSNIQSLVQTHSSSHITDRGSGRGLSLLKMDSAVEEYLVRPEKMRDMLDLILSELPSEIRHTLSKAIQKITLADYAGKAHHFKVDFVDGSGNMHVMHLAMKPQSDGRVLMRFASLSGQFKLAQDFMVISHSESDWFGSEKWDEIVYMNRGITHHDIATILAGMSPLGAFNMLASPQEMKRLPGSEEL